MDCKDGKEFIGLYLAGDLPQEKMSQLAQHISVCAKCSEEFEQAKRIELSFKEALLLTAREMRSPKSRILRKIEPEAKKRRRRAKFVSSYLFLLILTASLCLVLFLAYAGLLAIGKAKLSQQKELASGEIQLLITAIHLYRDDCGEYPLSGNANLVLALSAEQKHKPDSRYYDFALKRLEDGQFLDPWDSAYIYLRTESGFLIYSAGPNKTDEQRMGDDISH